MGFTKQEFDESEELDDVEEDATRMTDAEFDFDEDLTMKFLTK